MNNITDDKVNNNIRNQDIILETLPFALLPIIFLLLAINVIIKISIGARMPLIDAE